MAKIEGPSADQVVEAAPAVLVALSDLLQRGTCDIPASNLDVFCVATLNLLAQLVEEYADLAGIGPGDVVRQLADRMFTDSRQVRKPGPRSSPLSSDGVS